MIIDVVDYTVNTLAVRYIIVLYYSIGAVVKSRIDVVSVMGENM